MYKVSMYLYREGMGGTVTEVLRGSQRRRQRTSSLDQDHTVTDAAGRARWWRVGGMAGVGVGYTAAAGPTTVAGGRIIPESHGEPICGRRAP